MTYQEAEQKAFRLGRAGYRLAMDQKQGIWAWQWNYPNRIITPTSTTNAAPKAVALIFALSEIHEA